MDKNINEVGLLKIIDFLNKRNEQLSLSFIELQQENKQLAKELQMLSDFTRKDIHICDECDEQIEDGGVCLVYCTSCYEETPMFSILTESNKECNVCKNHIHDGEDFILDTSYICIPCNLEKNFV